ncbi:MAG: sulfatase [Pirellulaceae bacterium]
MMKRILGCLLVPLLASAVLVDAAEPKPNIVLILSDDQGWMDYGFTGHESIETPHLDELAKRSVVFERGYVASPLCRPSLASIITGRFPTEHGITGNDVDGRNNREALDKPLRAAFHKFPSFVRELTASGYLTHQSGKWWEGSYQDGGFTHGMTRGGRHGDAGLTIGREGLKPVTDFIDMAKAEKQPFFVWYAPFLPHTPHNPPPRLLEKYSEPDRAPDVAKYDAMCEWFDETCGELLDHLDRQGLRENTIVLYICDNGWAATSTNAADPNQQRWKGFALRSKGSPYEMGIRTPIMISWPARLEPVRSPDLAHAIDLFPTITAMAGIKTPDDLQGINLLDEQARQDRDTLFGVVHSIHTIIPGKPDDTLQYLWCVSGDWKLLLRYHGQDTTQYKNVHLWDTHPVRLYNLKDDPHEKNELSASHPEIVVKLRQKIEAWHPLGKK